MPINKVFDFYNRIVKPAYVEIEARGNSLPIELLFEIHSALDHISRIHSDHDDAEKCVEKALSHLKRGILDVFKLKLKYCNQAMERLELKGIDLTLIGDGKFYEEFTQLRYSIKKTAKMARLEEKKAGNCSDDIEEAFRSWLETSALIDNMEENYLNSPKISWAKLKTIKLLTINTLIGFIIGVVSSLSAAGIIWYITR
jgi:hypothetical protein